MPECPYCHVGIVENVDMTNFETSITTVYLYYTGDCRKCHRSFKWREIYTIKDPCDNLEELE